MLGKSQIAIANASPAIFCKLFFDKLLVFYCTSVIMIIVEKIADVAELVDAPDLGSGVFGREGSSPFIRIKKAIVL